ncbi:MAG TPA: DUF4349 domain-containing protein, partial [Actinomycetota bacterium]|nr:DUF4349 domain-containing protein [Actinomycetota bacterium]
MNTEIEFLELLELDLREATERGLTGDPDSTLRARRRLAASRVLVAAMVAMFILVAGVVGYAVRGDSGSTQALSRTSGAGSGGSTDGAHKGLFRPLAPTRVESLGSGVQSAGSDLGVMPGPSPVAGRTPATGSVQEPVRLRPKIVKTADLEVQVKKGSFDEAFRAASLVADRYGGYIASSSMGRSSVRDGRITIRVPARRFAQAVADLAALGQVRQETVNGEDVTADYVDLQGRIRTWRAQEAVLLRLMGQTDSIDETLTVQRQLQSVQLQIERLKGQFRVLRDQVADGTISISLHEPEPAMAKKAGPPSIYPGFGNTWRKATAGFLDVLAAVAVGLGYLIPISLLALGGWLLI